MAVRTGGILAGTYIAYLSGNVGAMRFPVATAVQKNMNADITTPRGQIVTIVGIVASVVANLILLLITVLAGSWVLSILPQTVIDSFSFVVAGLLGAMVLMQFSGDGGKTIAVKDILIKIVYLVLAAFLYVVCNIWITSLMAWGMAIAVLSCILLSYVIYRIDLKKAESGEQ